MTRHRLRIVSIALTTVTALSAGLLGFAQAAEPRPPKDAAQGWNNQSVKKKQPKPNPNSIPSKKRTSILGKNYKVSQDTAFTTSGDSTGLHLLVADERDGYAWETVATLSEVGFAVDTWIGNACVTESGRYAAVAYAPRTFTNEPELMVRGAFTAVVNLANGEVTKLPFTASLAYFSPGCGEGDEAVFTQLSYDGDEKQRTRLISVNAATGKHAKPVTFPGQVTSAIPVGKGIVAAHGNKLVRINGKKETELVRTRTVPFQITADARGGVSFIDRELDKSSEKEAKSWAKYLTPSKVRGRKVEATTVAVGNLTEWDLAGTASGKVFITGKAKNSGKLPKAVKNPGGIAKGARMSSHGDAAISTAWADGKTSLITPEEVGTARAASTEIRVLATDETITLDVTPDVTGKHAATGRTKSPALPGSTIGAGAGISTQTLHTQAVAGSPHDPSEGTEERTCSIPRNDVQKQAFQPTPRQVEWAVDQAVVGELNFYRSPGWKNTGMGGYSPQDLFPPIVLAGDPNGTLDNEDPDVTDKWHIPSQILLGVTAQESNMWQATRFAVPGVTANPLIGNYYGVDYTASGEQSDPWHINWFDADCGYGITQVTDGMRLPGHGQETLSTLQQEAVALDYTANIAAGAQILSEKWNQTYNAGMKINGGHPQWIENWFFALWAYNSGFHPKDADTHWGLGWTNNPANPLWKANRTPFLEDEHGDDDYSHAAHPQDWPYQEKVIGWAARPISAMFAPGDFQPGYRPAWWNSEGARTNAKPPIDLFCDASNNCDPSKISEGDDNDAGQGACTLDNGDGDTNPHWLHCWWDKSVTWKDCELRAACGYAVHRFNTSYPEQPDANSYPPRCATGLPANALIVDDLPDGTIPAGSDSRGCGAVKSDGTFAFDFVPWDSTMEKPDGSTTSITTYPGKIDTHQIGAAYQNHFWFTHTRSPEEYPGNANRMKVTATWKLGQKIPGDGQAEVFAHIPDHGAQTEKAEYKIKTAFGIRTKTISQTDNSSNKWVSLGAYRFNDVVPEVALNNFNGIGTGDKDIAFDAVAFVPGDYDGMPTITFSDPDLNAEPADLNDIVDMSPEVSGDAPDTWQRDQFAAMKPTFVDWCSGREFGFGAAPKHHLTRHQGCIKGQFGGVKKINGAIVGRVSFNYQIEISLQNKEGGFNSVLKVQPHIFSGQSASETVSLQISGNCSVGCNTAGRVGKGTPSWVWSTGDRHLVSVQLGHSWNEVRKSAGIGLNWQIQITSGGMPAVNPASIGTDNDSRIRCDRIVMATPGCVFGEYIPTYSMNSQKYPAAAAHAWLVQHELPDHFGLRGEGLPLTYLGPEVMSKVDPGKSQKQVNRKHICPDRYKRNPLASLSPELHPENEDARSCDELSFASTFQSGGTPESMGGTNFVSSGDECLQTYAKRNSDGTWQLLLDDRYPLPTWNEKCGRSTISNNQNTGSMRPFGEFITDYRLITKDGYWLHVAKPR